MGEPVLVESVKNDAKIRLASMKRLLRNLQQDGLIYLHDDFLQTTTLQRVKLATLAFKLGADYERVCSCLDWKEFEDVAAIALEMCGYEVTSNVRFRQGGRKWELDIVGCRRPIVVCIDCKHWLRGLYPSKLKRVVDEQLERTAAFSESFPNPAVRVECASWEEARFVPVILSLMPASFKIYKKTPLVPILQVQDFLTQLPMCLDSFRSFDKTQPHLKTA